MPRTLNPAVSAADGSRHHEVPAATAPRPLSAVEELRLALESALGPGRHRRHEPLPPDGAPATRAPAPGARAGADQHQPVRRRPKLRWPSRPRRRSAPRLPSPNASSTSAPTTITSMRWTPTPARSSGSSPPKAASAASPLSGAISSSSAPKTSTSTARGRNWRRGLALSHLAPCPLLATHLR